MIQHGAGEEIGCSKGRKKGRKEWLYDLRWRATNNLLPYELEARIKIEENERHWKVQLFAFFRDHC